jgi:DNA-binding MarR family transcriptional regulator/GNAT superfamily N-acetyltransferase
MDDVNQLEDPGVTMRASDPTEIAAVRRFNRFYTRIIGTLDEHLLRSKFSLAEARVLYELANRTEPIASDIAADLNLDMGYLSRILRTFSSAKLLRRHRSKQDGRQTLLSLTSVGQYQFKILDQRSIDQVHQILHPLNAEQRTRLIYSMSAIESILSPIPPAAKPVTLRAHRPGDMGWVIERHGVLYTQEYGWDQRFEALVARIAADFIDHFDSARERCWIAERDGERLGCVFLVKDTESPASSKTGIPNESTRWGEKTARLRMLLVEPSARGLGLGRTLVQQCTAFARNAGYRRIVLWTNSVLDAARRIYQQEGYKLIAERPSKNFGKQLISQDWELNL